MASGHNNSAVSSATFTRSSTTTPTAARPTITPNGGSFSSSVQVSLKSATSGSTIYYTTNGSTPSAGSTRYTGPFTLTATATVRAFALASGYNNSAVASATFTKSTSGGGGTGGGTPTGGSQQSYGGSPRSVPGTIEAEDYDTGGEGAAYHDTSAGNKGGQYRTDGVDIWKAYNEYYTGANSNGEWLEYTVNVATSGTYSLDLNVATPNNGRKMRVKLDGKDITGSISVPNTGGWLEWETVMTTVQLSAGNHVLRVEFELGGLNFDWIDISPIGSTSGGTTTGGSTAGQQPYGGTPLRLPGTIEAEDYDTGGEGVAYHDTNAGNKGGQYRTDAVDIWKAYKDYYTGANSSGEWLEYTVNVAYAGSYKLDLRVATPLSGRKLRVKLDGVDVTGLISVPNTGGWLAWQTVRATANLKAGKHVLRVEFIQGGLNLNWIDAY